MNKLRICVFTPYFYPEDFKINDIVFEFAGRNHVLTVITPIPNYPKGRYFKGYSLIRRRKERLNNVEIIRLPVIPRGNGKKIMMVMNYISFLLTSLGYVFFLSLRKKYDLVFIHQLSPVLIAIPAVIMSKYQKIPLYSWVLDLWPESVQAAGGIKNKIIINNLKKMVIYIYKNCTKILIGSTGFEKSINEKRDFKSKLIYFPNWAEEIVENSSKINIHEIYPFSQFSKEDFILLFAGNIGEAQNLGALIDAAEITKDNQNIKWVFLGDGRQRQYLVNKVISLGLETIVFFPGRFPLETMPAFMKTADVLLVSLKNELIFNLTVPQKVQFYMAQGKPILAMLNGDGAELISKAECGYCIPAGDVQGLVNIVRELYPKRNMLYELGKNGKSYYEKNFKKKDRMDQLENILLGIENNV